MKATNELIAIDKANANLALLFGYNRKITLSEVRARSLKKGWLGVESDPKTVKGSKLNYLTGILYLAPGKLSGFNICPGASPGCLANCLGTHAGRGRQYGVTRARVVKTLAFFLFRDQSVKNIKQDISALVRKATKRGMSPVVRLNGTSDILWDKVTDIVQSFPNVQFYDYTKLSGRFKAPLPVNYDLTFSKSETNGEKMGEILASGGRVAVVFRSALPESYHGHKVVNADSSDLRFLDGKSVISGLIAKGSAKHDESGFVV